MLAFGEAHGRFAEDLADFGFGARLPAVAAPALVALGNQAGPGGKVVLVAEGAQVGTDFPGELHPAQRTDAGQKRGIASAAQREQLAVEVGDLRSIVPHHLDFLSGLGLLDGPLGVEPLEERGDLGVAGGHLLLVEAIGFQRLAQGKEMMFLPVALQTGEHFGLFLFQDLLFAQGGEHRRVALAREDGFDDPQTADPVDLWRKTWCRRTFIKSRARCLCATWAPAMER